MSPGPVDPARPRRGGSSRRGRGTSISPAASSTTAATPATCSSGPRRGRPPARVAAGRLRPHAAGRLRHRDPQRRAGPGTDRRRPARAHLGGAPRRSTTPRRCAPSTASARRRWWRLVDRAQAAGDTLGGAVTVIAHGVPGGARLARPVGREARRPAGPGGDVGAGGQGGGDRRGAGRLPRLRQRRPRRHRARRGAAGGGWHRPTNRAGGTEGGVTNGEDVVVTAYKKPISTLAQGAAQRRSRHPGAPPLAVRAQRRHRAAGRRRDRRGDGRPGARRRPDREARRRFAAGSARPPRRDPGAAAALARPLAASSRMSRAANRNQGAREDAEGHR